MRRTVLFLCTGNYYRSRFAELLFNARASKSQVDWWAYSRGLALERGINNVGPISRNAVQALQVLGITLHEEPRYPLQAEDDDFRAASVIIALKQEEHEPYIRERYPAWMDRVRYWHVHDVVPGPDYDPLKDIACQVQTLIDTLRHG